MYTLFAMVKLETLINMYVCTNCNNNNNNTNLCRYNLIIKYIIPTAKYKSSPFFINIIKMEIRIIKFLLIRIAEKLLFFGLDYIIPQTRKRLKVVVKIHKN